MRAVIVLAATGIAAAGFGAGAALAQDADIGKREYMNNCAGCHGESGKGDGPVAELLKTSLPDLTQIQKTNNGNFPFERLYEIIDGRAEIRAHGTREMPIWGNEYSADAPFLLGPYGSQEDVEPFVRGRILALIGHLHSLQER